MRLFAFNLTNFDPAQWPPFSFEVMRLWDTGVTWRDIEPSPGIYNFLRLDQQIALAMSHGVKEIIYVLGKTPAFYGGGTNGAGPPTDNAKAVAFAIKLVTHIKSTFPTLVLDWEQWNEPNLLQTWTGTAAQLLALSRALYATLHPLGIKVLSPSGSGGTAIGNFILAYLTACAKNYPFDVFAYHAYLNDHNPDPTIGLEKILEDIKVKKASFGITGPTWFTEGSWGRDTDYSPALTEAEKATYLTILYTKCKAAGVEVFCWYEGDTHGFGVIIGNAAGLAFASLAGSLPVSRTTQVSLPVAAITPPVIIPPSFSVQPGAVTPPTITPPSIQLTIQDNTANGVNAALNGTTLTLTDRRSP
jgi:hypothetical protein